MSKKEIKKLNGYQTKERQKQLKKNEQRNQISSLEGFDELKFKVLNHLSKNHFTSKSIDTTNIKDFDKDVKKLVEFTRKNDFKKPIDIDVIIENRARLNSYISQTFEKSGIVYQPSKSYFEKWLEQRIRNTGIDKTMDNFRYIILRAFDLASTNQYPYGIDINSDKFTMGAFDRSNLTEFEIINCLKYLNAQDMNMSVEDYNGLLRDGNKDSLNKQHIIEVINHIKEEYPVTYPKELDEFLVKIDNDGVSTEYLVSDILSQEEINNVLNRHNACRILIGHREVISKELENLNNKNNPWHECNFLYQTINSKTGLQFVDEAIEALEKDDYEDCLKWHKHLIEKAPEHALIPVIAHDVFKPSDFTTSTEFIENYKKLADLYEGKNFHTNNEKWLLRKYENLTEIPKFRYSLINDFYGVECEELWNLTVTKLKKLRKVIRKLKNQNKKTHHQINEFSNIILNQIDGLTSKLFGYNVYVELSALFAGDGKTLKNSPDNVVKAFELFLDTYFGDDVFEVDLKKFTYTIKDNEFLKVITQVDSGGYANSHAGRAQYFASSKLKEYKQEYQNFENYQGTNDELVDNQIEVINKLLGVTRFGWREDTVAGGVVYCGWDGNNRDNTSWEHIDNTTQSLGAIRATETNSSDGAKTKPFKTISGYFEYILDQQDSPKVVKDYHDNGERQVVKYQLGKIIKHYKDEEKV